MTDNLYKISELVKEILESDASTRDSDNILYYRVLQVIGRRNDIDIDTMSMPRFLLHMKEYGFPQFETVRRTRQKIQHDNPELAGSKTVEGWRKMKEEVYREYAVSEERMVR